MSDEIEYELTPEQWEVLRALRTPAENPAAIRRFAVERLIELGLAAMRGNSIALTPLGRKVLIRGSSKLLHDVAA